MILLFELCKRGKFRETEGRIEVTWMRERNHKAFLFFFLTGTEFLLRIMRVFVMGGSDGFPVFTYLTPPSTIRISFLLI